MKNRLGSTYDKVFAILKILIPQLNPNTIKIDFELAAIEYLKSSFPLFIISGCQFHLDQSILRKVREHGLIQLYRLDSNFKKIINSLLALCFVIPSQINNTFNQLKLCENFPEAVLPIYNYFYNNYIGDGRRYSIDCWNIGGNYNPEIPKTNNAIEGFHNSLKNYFGTSFYSFPLLITQLKSTEDKYRMVPMRMELGNYFPRRSEYIIKETSLELFLGMYDSEDHKGTNFVFNLIQYLNYNTNNN